jgi:hypothetical protein
MKYLIFSTLACFCLSFQAAGDSDHPNLTGKWRLDTTKSEIHSVKDIQEWDIQQSDDVIEIASQAQGRTESIKCATTGKDCNSKEAGESAQISFYYNGPMLIEMDLLGHNKEHVVKKRMKLGADGKTLEVEVMHITPQAPTDKLVFEKL